VDLLGLPSPAIDQVGQWLVEMCKSAVTWLDEAGESHSQSRISRLCTAALGLGDVRDARLNNAVPTFSTGRPPAKRVCMARVRLSYPSRRESVAGGGGQHHDSSSTIAARLSPVRTLMQKPPAGLARAS
jgi:hypothetical protein